MDLEFAEPQALLIALGVKAVPASDAADFPRIGNGVVVATAGNIAALTAVVHDHDFSIVSVNFGNRLTESIHDRPGISGLFALCLQNLGIRPLF